MSEADSILARYHFCVSTSVQRKLHGSIQLEGWLAGVKFVSSKALFAPASSRGVKMFTGRKFPLCTSGLRLCRKILDMRGFVGRKVVGSVRCMVSRREASSLPSVTAAHQPAPLRDTQEFLMLNTVPLKCTFSTRSIIVPTFVSTVTFC